MTAMLLVAGVSDLVNSKQSAWLMIAEGFITCTILLDISITFTLSPQTYARRRLWLYCEAGILAGLLVVGMFMLARHRQLRSETDLEIADMAILALRMLLQISRLSLYLGKAMQANHATSATEEIVLPTDPCLRERTSSSKCLNKATEYLV